MLLIPKVEAMLCGERRRLPRRFHGGRNRSSLGRAGSLGVNHCRFCKIIRLIIGNQTQ